MKILQAFMVVMMFASCVSNRKTVDTKTEPAKAPLSETLAQKQQDGVDFFARGSIPASWTVEIEFGNLIRFKSIDGNTVNSSAVQPQFDPGQKRTTYISKSTSGDILIVVEDAGCTDPLSGEKFEKKVIVTVDNKRYEGCGQYLFDSKLEGKWILQKINNKTMVAADFAKGLPLIDLQLTAGRISGHDGCNSISGSFEVLGNKVKFNPLASTKMACPGNKAGNEIGPLLSGQTVDYYFNNGQLFFYLQDDSIIVFSKG